MMVVLAREAAKWVAILYDEHAIELVDIGLFLDMLPCQIEDMTRVHQTEGELLTL